MSNAYFLVQIKHNSANDTWDKGVVVKAAANEDNRGAALQSYHAYLGAYAYGHDTSIDYVHCQVIDGATGIAIIKEQWPEV